MKRDAYIAEHGVTKIPGYGDPGFAELHKQRMRDYDEASMSKKAKMLKAGVIQ
jgi:hypothetical protein